jgi:hypothetical protein
MKKLIFLLLFIPVICSAQKNSMLKTDTLKLKHSPGYYLTKSSNQIMGGIVCGVLAGAVVSSIPAKVNERKPYYYGATGLAIIGFVLELSGIENLRKAGISLDENGIGIKIKF